MELVEAFRSCIAAVNLYVQLLIIYLQLNVLLPRLHLMVL